MRRVLFACLAAMVACDSNSRSADVEMLFVGDSACTDCSIVAKEIGNVGVDGPGPAIDARLASDGDSLIAVAPLLGHDSVGIFLMSGALQHQAPLPQGWHSVSAVDFSGRHSLVLLSELRAHLLFVDMAGELDHQLTVPRNTHRFLTQANNVVVNAELRTADGVGFPLHQLTATGNIARSFGAKDEKVVPRTESNWRRKLAWSQSGNVWSAHPDNYVIELWNMRGHLVRHLERRSASWDSVRAGAAPDLFATEKPSGEVIAIWEDQAGLLWIQLKVASRQWRQISAAEIKRRHDAPFQLSEYDEFFDTVVEVLDPESGKLVTTARFPGAVGLLLKGNVYAKWVQTGPEKYVLRLQQLTLVGSAQR